MGLIVNVYTDKSGTDCTNGGVSSKVNSLTVINVDGPFEPTEDRPAVVLAIGPYNTARLIPADLHEANEWVMYGGNIGVTSDSRFGEAVGKLTGRKFADGIVKIFDRVETAEQMRRLSI